MDFIISSDTPQILAAKLVDSGVLVMGETGAVAAPGVLFSYIGESNNLAHAFVAINENLVANAAEIFTRLEADINQPGAPLRCRAGELPPEVIEALPDWAYRKALASLGLEAAWETAVMAAVNTSGSKDAYIWWDRTLKISTLEPEWVAIVVEMDWGKDSVIVLIQTAQDIYKGVK
jgi:hypothetical protein